MLLNIDDAAEYLKLSRATLRRLVQAGQLPRVQIGGRVLFRKVALDAFIKKHERSMRKPEAVER